MHYLFESLFVGVYSAIIYICCSYFTLKYDFKIILFIVGFLKHLLGDLLQIHTYYCNYGYACNKTGASPVKMISSISLMQLFLECIGEGILFVILGTILVQSSYLKENKIALFFIMGFSLHTIFELMGAHKLFCKTHCTKKSLVKT